VKLQDPDYTFDYCSGVNLSFVHKGMPCGELYDVDIFHNVKDPLEFYTQLKNKLVCFVLCAIV
jgi:hypothetical protein